MKEYLDQIIFWCGVAVAALGGTSVSITAIVRWIKRIVTSAIDKLTAKTFNYEDKIADLSLLADKLLETEGRLKRLSDSVREYSEEIASLKGDIASITEMNLALMQALTLVAGNTPYMVSNGTAAEIAKLLGTDKKVVKGVTNEN